MTLGELIASLRLKKGLNQREFADQLGTTEATINRWENNKAVPRAKAKKAMADLFQIDVEELHEGQGSAIINEVSLQRATVVSWLRDRFALGYTLTLVTRSGHFNVVIARRTIESQAIDVLTGLFDFEDILPLIRDGVISTFCNASAEEFNRLRSMQLRDSELVEFLSTAERFESNKVFSGLLEQGGFPESADEAILLEKWRQLNKAQQKSIMVLIDINLKPKELDEAELKRLVEMAEASDSAGGE